MPICSGVLSSSGGRQQQCLPCKDKDRLGRAKFNLNSQYRLKEAAKESVRRGGGWNEFCLVLRWDGASFVSCAAKEERCVYEI